VLEDLSKKTVSRTFFHRKCIIPLGTIKKFI